MPGETEYVVSFYDPNATNTAVRYKDKKL
ncbi:ShET2/EspL2 family type III secretion system effector toxin [Escherichia coli]